MPTKSARDRIAADRESRITLTKPVAFFELSGPPSELCPAGTVAIVAGQNGSQLFDQVDAALRADDRYALDEAIRLGRSRQSSEKSKLLGEEEAARVMLESSAYCDVRFLGKTLLPNLYVTKEVDFLRYFLPFAGGAIVASDFQASYFVRQPDADIFKLLIVAHVPRLSDDQIRLTRRLPSESREMRIGNAESLFPTITILATVTAGLVGAGIGYALGRALQHISVDSFVEIERKELERSAVGLPKLASPTATVQALIAAKREALAHLEKV
jgi:hypothetical protein